MTPSWQTTLRALHPCPEARAWAASYETFAEAWTACERGDWMLWLIGRTVGAPKNNAERKRLVLTACACARLALPYVEAGEQRPLKAIEMTERWARGDEDVTVDDVRKAAAAAAAYAAAYAADAAAAAAYAAAYAADAAYAAYAAAAAAAAADAYAAYAADARAKVLKQCAEIVREQWKAEELPL